MNCDITDAANEYFRAPCILRFRALSMWHVTFCCITELSLNSTFYMLVRSCIIFYKNILYINVFIIILKVVG